MALVDLVFKPPVVSFFFDLTFWLSLVASASSASSSVSMIWRADQLSAIERPCKRGRNMSKAFIPEGMQGFFEDICIRPRLMSDCSGCEGAWWALQELFGDYCEHVSSSFGLIGY